MATWYKINASAKLTVRADSLNVRSGPQLYDFVKSVKAGEVVQATERALISGDPWFHISDGWISGKYVEGWVKDNNNNNSWWYVEKNYGYPSATWRTIGGKDYCFGKDAYLFVYCYIKAADGVNYYWVDDDGVYMPEYTTKTPDRNKYRVVENYATENAYSGSAPSADKVYARNDYQTESQMKVNAQYILNYLRAKGWTKNAVCGMLGNMQSESTISPGRWQDGDAGNMNLGVGLTQWTKATKLYDWAAKNNLYPLDMDTQLKRILFEVTTTDPNEIQYTPKSPQYPLTFQQFTKSTQTPYDLACAFLHCYEKPKNSQQDATRGAQATEWFNALS